MSIDPKVTRGIIVLVSLALQAYVGLPVTMESIMWALAMLGIGAAVVRRPGDKDVGGI